MHCSESSGRMNLGRIEGDRERRIDREEELLVALPPVFDDCDVGRTRRSCHLHLPPLSDRFDLSSYENPVLYVPRRITER
jgi:hypothetical protein